MTEREWLACDEPHRMIGAYERRELVPARLDQMRYWWRGDPRGDRKWRLFACAACRMVWPLLTDDRLRSYVELMERHAECESDQVTLVRGLLAARAAEEWAQARVHDESSVPEQKAKAATLAAGAVTWLGFPSAGFPPSVTIHVVNYVVQAAVQADGGGEYLPRSRLAATLLRDVVGNPFRPLALDSRWLTTDVTALARTIHADRTYDLLPILADALADAGCDAVELLDHCRRDLPHVRGCWAIDLLLGKGGPSTGTMT